MSAFSTAQLPKAGDVVASKFWLERLLGQGGMGAVYAARHLTLGHSVAIKVMLAGADNEEAARRFKAEGTAAANIQSEHVLRVHDIGEENGYAYMILDLLEGEDLAQILDREIRLEPHIAVGYVIQALKGMKEAHARGIVHRDLKPSNLFLARRADGSVIVKVLDFGISKLHNANPLGQTPGALTSTKAMLGSPLYMSPEQLRSSKNVDARADIWAIGVILYELVSGALPFGGENLGELFAKILEEDATPLRRVAPNAPPGLEAIVTRCLQRRPEHRFQTVVELENELAPFATAAAASAVPTSMATVAMAGPRASSYAAPIGPSTPNGLAIGPHTPNGLGGAIGPNTPSGYGAPIGPNTPNGYGAPIGPNTPNGYGPPSAAAPGSNVAAGPRPHVQAQTGSAWQSTGSGASKSKSSVALALVGGFAVLAVIGIGLVAWSSLKGKHPTDVPVSGAGGSSSAIVSAAPVASASAAAPSATPTAVAVPSATVATSASAAPEVHSTPGSRTVAGGTSRHGPGPTGAPGTAAKNEPPPPEPPKPEPPKPEPPKTAATPPKPPPTLSSGPLQGVR